MSLQRFKDTCQKLDLTFSDWLILIDLSSQKLDLLYQETITATYSISSGIKGIGQEEGSGKTPLGLHVIQEKIGDGADPYAIFKSRLNTGEIAIPNGKEYITSRILRISGLEEGFNKGTDANGTVVDTFARYVYIHGTNEIDQIGKPAGAGCVRLKPDDMIALFNKIPNNTPVYIYV